MRLEAPGLPHFFASYSGHEANAAIETGEASKDICPADDVFKRKQFKEPRRPPSPKSLAWVKEPY
jgi:hypothetical protein